MERRTEIIAPPTAYLVEPGEGESRSARLQPEHLRPLSRLGSEHALALARSLSRMPIGRVVIAPDLRCRGTVEPLAMRLGVDVESLDALNADSDMSGTVELLHGNRVTLICAPMLTVRTLVRHLEAAGTGSVERVTASDLPVVWIVRHRVAAVTPGADVSYASLLPQAVY